MATAGNKGLGDFLVEGKGEEGCIKDDTMLELDPILKLTQYTSVEVGSAVIFFIVFAMWSWAFVSTDKLFATLTNHTEGTRLSLAAGTFISLVVAAFAISKVNSCIQGNGCIGHENRVLQMQMTLFCLVLFSFYKIVQGLAPIHHDTFYGKTMSFFFLFLVFTMLLMAFIFQTDPINSQIPCEATTLFIGRLVLWPLIIIMLTNVELRFLQVEQKAIRVLFFLVSVAAFSPVLAVFLTSPNESSCAHDTNIDPNRLGSLVVAVPVSVVAVLYFALIWLPAQKDKITAPTAPNNTSEGGVNRGSNKHSTGQETPGTTAPTPNAPKQPTSEPTSKGGSNQDPAVTSETASKGGSNGNKENTTDQPGGPQNPQTNENDSLSV